MLLWWLIILESVTVSPLVNAVHGDRLNMPPTIVAVAAVACVRTCDLTPRLGLVRVALFLVVPVSSLAGRSFQIQAPLFDPFFFFFCCPQW